MLPGLVVVFGGITLVWYGFTDPEGGIITALRNVIAGKPADANNASRRAERRAATIQALYSGAGEGGGAVAAGSVVVSGKRAYPTTITATSGTYPGHSGIDFRTPLGTPVYAPASGVVSKAVRSSVSYGNHVVLQVPGGSIILAHLSDFSVSAGDRVTIGQGIGRTGTSGNSTGPHLHMEFVPTGNSPGAPGNRAATATWLQGAQKVGKSEGTRT